MIHCACCRCPGLHGRRGNHRHAPAGSPQPLRRARRRLRSEKRHRHIPQAAERCTLPWPTAGAEDALQAADAELKLPCTKYLQAMYSVQLPLVIPGYLQCSAVEYVGFDGLPTITSRLQSSVQGSTACASGPQGSTRASSRARQSSSARWAGTCGARRRPPSRATAPSRRATDPPAIRLADSDSDSDTASDSDVWPAGEYARFQPRTAEFQRAVGEDVRGAPEAALTRHSALTQGD